jgi:hypothetical protein
MWGRRGCEALGGQRIDEIGRETTAFSIHVVPPLSVAQVYVTDTVVIFFYIFEL